MFKFALAELGQISPRDQRQDDVCRISLFNRRFETNRVRGVDQNTCMVRDHHRINDGGQVVDIGEGFYAENDVVKGAFFAIQSLFW